MDSIPPRRIEARPHMHKHPQAQLLLRAHCERKDVIGRGDSKPQAAANLPRAGEVGGGDPTKKRSFCGVFLLQRGTSHKSSSETTAAAAVCTLTSTQEIVCGAYCCCCTVDRGYVRSSGLQSLVASIGKLRRAILWLQTMYCSLVASSGRL